jgi:DNA-binding response OmpR family regulator
MTIDRLRRTVTVKGQVRPIKPREFALLETLARRPGIVFSRERCITLAWPDDTDAIDRTVDVHVARLRRKFGRDTVNIRTVPGGDTLIVTRIDRLARSIRRFGGSRAAKHARFFTGRR